MGLEKSDASHIHIVIILFSVNLNHAMSIDVYSIRFISFVIEAISSLSYTVTQCRPKPTGFMCQKWHFSTSYLRWGVFFLRVSWKLKIWTPNNYWISRILVVFCSMYLITHTSSSVLLIIFKTRYPNAWRKGSSFLMVSRRRDESSVRSDLMKCQTTLTVRKYCTQSCTVLSRVAVLLRVSCLWWSRVTIARSSTISAIEF